MKAGAILAALILMGASEPPALTKYVGKYAFDKVEGRTFLDDPTVRAAVKRAAPNQMLEHQVLTAEVTTPIENRDGIVASSSCQAHDCPRQNWTVAVSSQTKKAAICYYQRGLTDGGRWFVDGQLVVVDHERGCDSLLPPQVHAALQ